MPISVQVCLCHFISNKQANLCRNLNDCCILQGKKVFWQGERDIPWKEKHYTHLTVPKIEFNFREDKNRVSLVTTNQLFALFSTRM